MFDEESGDEGEDSLWTAEPELLIPEVFSELAEMLTLAQFAGQK